MSLKTDFLDGANGFNQKMQAVAAAGEQWVVDNTPNLTSQLQQAAAKGLKKFTITLIVSFEPGNLRLKGLHWMSFRSGIVKALIAEDIYTHEVDPKLNTQDNVETRIDLAFDFTGQIA